ncbi:uncharacterized protein TNCT_664421 [Trichonephila clavata]|uniref:Uncharacterized protein n=1 Tax=Trichonephila clavata TaxID=2740835 RepID=A0A8X6L1U2_TRICU|nr:uncharacterized protein TNCT_664421 [Trichonephila clavata]
MKSLAGDNITEKALRTLWLDKLPDSIKNILVVSSENLENLSVTADKIFEINSSPEIYSATADNSAMKNILENVSLLEKQISELYINRRKSRSEFRNSSQTRNKIRSRSEKSDAETKPNLRKTRSGRRVHFPDYFESSR